MDAANLALAQQLAETIGRKQFWTIQYERDAAYIVSDPVAQCSGMGRGRYMVTDADAVDRARKAGVRCEDDGKIL